MVAGREAALLSIIFARLLCADAEPKVLEVLPDLEVKTDGPVMLKWPVGHGARVWCEIQDAATANEPTDIDAFISKVEAQLMDTSSTESSTSSASSSTTSHAGETTTKADAGGSSTTPTTTTTQPTASTSSTASTGASATASSTKEADPSSSSSTESAGGTTATASATTTTTTTTQAKIDTTSPDFIRVLIGMGKCMGMTDKISCEAKEEQCKWYEPPVSSGDNETSDHDLNPGGCSIINPDSTEFQRLVKMNAKERLLWQSASCRAIDKEEKCKVEAKCEWLDAGVCEFKPLEAMTLWNKEMRKQGEQCLNSSKATCDGICIWNKTKEACTVTFDHFMDAIGMRKAKEESLQPLAKKAATCSEFKVADNCTDDCSWRDLGGKEKGGVCELSAKGAFAAMIGFGEGDDQLAKLAELSMHCKKNPPHRCFGSCSWPQASSSCEPSPIAVLKILNGTDFRPGDESPDQPTEFQVVIELQEQQRKCQGQEEESGCKQDDKCSWTDTELCDLNAWAAMTQLGATGKIGTPIAILTMQAIHCMSFRNEGNCSNMAECQWDAKDGECEVETDFAQRLFMDGQALYGGHGMEQIMKKQAECDQRNKDQCHNDNVCDWNDGTKKCEAHFLFALFSLNNTGSQEESDPWKELVEKVAFCHAFIEENCTGGCVWDPKDKECEVNPNVAWDHIFNGTDSNKHPCADLDKQACSAAGTCEWREGQCVDTSETPSENQTDDNGGENQTDNTTGNTSLPDDVSKPVELDKAVSDQLVELCSVRSEENCRGLKGCDWDGEVCKPVEIVHLVVLGTLQMPSESTEQLMELWQKCENRTQTDCENTEDCWWRKEQCQMNGTSAFNIILSSNVTTTTTTPTGVSSRRLLGEQVLGADAPINQVVTAGQGEKGEAADNGRDISPQLANKSEFRAGKAKLKEMGLLDGWAKLKPQDKLILHRASCQAAANQSRCWEEKKCEWLDSGVCEIKPLQLLSIWNKDLRAQGEQCQSMKKAECNGICVWNETREACTLTFEHLKEALGLKLSQADSLQPLAVKAAACMEFVNASNCTDDCIWREVADKPTGGVCELSQKGALSAMTGFSAGPGGRISALAELTMHCKTKPKDLCVGACQWGKNTSSCDATIMAVLKVMNGEDFRPGSGSPDQPNEGEVVVMLLESQHGCQEHDEESACVKDANCSWDKGTELCDLSPWVAMTKMGGDGNKTGTAAAIVTMKALQCHTFHDPANCTDQCTWDAADGECEVDGMFVMTALTTGEVRSNPGVTAAALLAKATTCRSIAQEANCTGDCSWLHGKCGLNIMATLTEGAHKEDGLEKIMAKQSECIQRTQETCSVDKDCEWSVAHQSCEASYLYALGMVNSTDTGNWTGLVGQVSACHTFSQKNCSGHCTWDDTDKECEVSADLVAQLFFGANSTGDKTNATNATVIKMESARRLESNIVNEGKRMFYRGGASTGKVAKECAQGVEADKEGCSQKAPNDSGKPAVLSVLLDDLSSGNYKAVCVAKDLRDLDKPNCSESFQVKDEACLLDPAKVKPLGKDKAYFMAAFQVQAGDKQGGGPSANDSESFYMSVFLIFAVLAVIVAGTWFWKQRGWSETCCGSSSNDREEDRHLYSTPNNYAPPVAPSWSHPENERFL